MPRVGQGCLDWYDGARAFARPGALRARLQDVVDVNVDLLVVKGDAALDLGTFELRSAVPPDDILQGLARRKADMVVARDALDRVCVSHKTLYDMLTMPAARRSNLVWALRSRCRGRKQVELAVGLGDVVPDREACLK